MNFKIFFPCAFAWMKATHRSVVTNNIQPLTMTWLMINVQGVIIPHLIQVANSDYGVQRGSTSEVA